MQRAPQTRKYDPEVLFPGGVNSYLDPQLLSSGTVRWAVNAVCKGAIWQTRPGFNTRYAFDVVNNGDIRDWYLNLGQPFLIPQFMRVLTFGDDTPYLIFGVSGTVFRAAINQDLTIDLPQVVDNLQFDRTVTQIVTVVTTKSSDVVDGVVTPCDPYQVLVIQDGITWAGYWSPKGSGHLNPEKRWTQNDAGDTLFTDGYNKTSLGYWMAWSGNRLWVANRNQVYASNLNDPLNFTDSITLVGVPVINFPDNVTGMHDRGITGFSNNVLFVFTAKTTWSLQSGISDRANWISTPNFQVKIYDSVGCVAGKSIISHRGILHWYSQDGIVSHDTINTVYSTQACPPIDSEMAASKAVMSVDRRSICCGSNDSYVFWSVSATPPIGGRIVNGHTQILDKTVVPGTVSGVGVPAWQGIWTGIQPVEWITESIRGRQFTWALSMDRDGIIRIWEAFQGNRSDNGLQIPWSIETRTHAISDSPFSNRKFCHIRAQLLQVYGNLGMRGFWRSTRGQFHKILDTTITATPGTVLIPNALFTPFTNKTASYNCRKQTRIVISEDVRGTNDENDSVDVENKYTDAIDGAFSLLFRFFGAAAIRAYWIASDVFTDNTEGEVVDAETGLRILPEPDGVDPFTVSGTTPDYVLSDSPPQFAFNPIEALAEEAEYAAIPVDVPYGTYTADIVPIEDVLSYTNFREFNPERLSIPTPANGTIIFRRSSYVDNGTQLIWSGIGPNGVYYNSSATVTLYDGIITGLTNIDVQLRVAGDQIIYNTILNNLPDGPSLPV